MEIYKKSPFIIKEKQTRSSFKKEGINYANKNKETISSWRI